MIEKQPSSEQGQVLVILVLVMVGLLAFTALAVDGGLIWAERRAAQNAGDAAVLAGGYRIANTLDDYQMGIHVDYDNWDCSSSDMLQAMEMGKVEALQQAAANGYTTTVKTATSINTVCVDQPLGLFDDKYVDTISGITSRVDTSFLHFAFGGEVNNSIGAISRVRPRMPLAYGFAIYSHGDGCNTGGNPGGIVFNGGGTGVVNVYGGGILSNSCLIGNGGVDVNVNGGGVGYGPGSSSVCNGAGCNISPSPQVQPKPVPDSALLFIKPDCSDLPNASSNGNGTISPGVYTGNVTVSGNENLVMNPGLYCFVGANFTANGGTVTGNGVTIYLDDGDISISGNVKAVLSAPTDPPSSPNQGVQGMLIFMDEDYDGNISLTGGGESSFTGVIFAAHPDSTVDISGNTNDIFNTQLIAGQVTVGGTAIVNVTFVDGNVYHLPANLTLQK
jgi:hypothetical protein